RFDAGGHAVDRLSRTGNALHGDNSRHRSARRDTCRSSARGGHTCSDGNRAAGAERLQISKETSLRYSRPSGLGNEYRGQDRLKSVLQKSAGATAKPSTVAPGE